MKSARLSSKGQIVIPQEIRDAHHWQAGMEFIIQETNDGIFLRPISSFTATKVEDVLGCIEYTGPKKSLQDMEKAIIAGAKKRK